MRVALTVPSPRLGSQFEGMRWDCQANDSNELGLKLDGKNSGLTKATFEKFAEERRFLRSAEVGNFLGLVKSERGRLIDFQENYELADGKIAKLLALAGERFRRMDGGAPMHAAQAKTIEASLVLDESANHPGPSLQKATDYAPISPAIDTNHCQSRTCKNPKGRTVLKGTRRKSGICSYCRPEV